MRPHVLARGRRGKEGPGPSGQLPAWPLASGVALLPPAARVQGVAQAVPDKVDGEDAQGDGDTGEDDGVLAGDEDPEAAAEGVGEHSAPLGGGGAGPEPDGQRDPGAVDYAREDVPTELVLAQEVRPAGRRELAGEVLLERVVGCDQGRKDSHQDEDAHDDRPGEGEAVGEEGAPEVFPAAPRLDAGGSNRILLGLRLGHLSTSPWGRGPRRGCRRR